ncbi:MAG: AfsR/SARP family transcriptional regulator, partial [Acidimicrobiia bacterium]
MSVAGNADFRLLGPFEIASGERVIEIGSVKQRLLLAMLTVERHRAVPLDVLAEELWGEHPPASVAAAVQTLVYRLRRSLGSAGVADSAGLRAVGSGYMLDLDAAQVDAHRFEDLAAQARAARAEGECAV